MGLSRWFYENHPNPACCLSLLCWSKCPSCGLSVIAWLWDTGEEKEATLVSPVMGSSPAFFWVPCISALPVIGNTATPATRKVVNRSKIKELAETTRPDCRHMRLRLNLGCVSKQETLNAESFPHTHSLIRVMHSWKWCVVRDFKVTLFQSTLSSFVTNWCFRYNE